MQAALAARYVANGYFPDTPSAMAFIKRIEEDSRSWRTIWRVLRLRRPSS